MEYPEEVKQDAISTIEALYPIDSEFEETKRIGERLLLEVVRSMDWRKALSTEALSNLALACSQKEIEEDLGLTRQSIKLGNIAMRGNE